MENVKTEKEVRNAMKFCLAAGLGCLIGAFFTFDYNLPITGSLLALTLVFASAYYGANKQLKSILDKTLHT